MRYSKLLTVLAAVLAAAVLATGLISPVYAAVFYAEPGGTGNGTAWNNTAELRVILTSGQLNDGDQVWAKTGTYYPTDGDDRSASFQLVSGVKIYGGFKEFTASTALGSRDPETHVTILSGDIGAADDSTDNSFHVVTSDSSITDSAVLDGFTVTKGYADGSYEESKNIGAGMLNQGSP